jgi:hypothetical protein
MIFEKEDRQAWMDSEVMREFERIAAEQDILAGPPPEAFEPVGVEEETEEPEWEEEEGDMGKLEDALTEFEGGEDLESPEKGTRETLEEMLGEAYGENLAKDLRKLANSFATDSKMRVAHRIERCIYELQSLKSGGKR